jgi:cell division initiation protein
MEITPLDIQQQKFKVRFRGFDVHEVDAFLEQVADAVTALKRENEALREEIRRFKLESQGYRKREETFKHAMLNSQKVMEEMKKSAEKSAELIVAEAEIKAEKILNKAHNRLTQLHEDIAGLKRQRTQLEVQMSSIIESHTRLLEIEKDGMKAMDEEDSKLKLLKKKQN